MMLPACVSQVLLLGAMRFGAMPVPLNGRLKAVSWSSWCTTPG